VTKLREEVLKAIQSPYRRRLLNGIVDLEEADNEAADAILQLLEDRIPRKSDFGEGDFIDPNNRALMEAFDKGYNACIAEFRRNIG